MASPTVTILIRPFAAGDELQTGGPATPFVFELVVNNISLLYPYDEDVQQDITVAGMEVEVRCTRTQTGASMVVTIGTYSWSMHG